MKQSNNDIYTTAENALRTCLLSVPFLKSLKFKKEISQENTRPDFLVSVALSNSKQDIILEVKKSGQPRYVRETVNQLLLYRKKFPKAYGVFIAPFISPEAGEICTKAGIGYLDLAGNCYLCFKNVYIKQEGKSNLFTKKRDLRSLYSPKGERVLRILISNPKKIWKIKELSIEANVSLGQTSNIKKLLNDREWIRSEKSGFSLKEPAMLLKEWRENYSYKKNIVYNFYSVKNISEVESTVAKVCNQKRLKYALTGFSGAARLAPMVKYQQSMIYIEKFNEDLISLLDFKEVPSGANINIFAPYDDGVFYRTCKVDGIQIVSPIQIYLDLFAYRGRGAEAAEAILKEVILPLW